MPLSKFCFAAAEAERSPANSLLTACLAKPQRFSMTLRSGLWGGHSFRFNASNPHERIASNASSVVWILATSDSRPPDASRHRPPVHASFSFPPVRRTMCSSLFSFVFSFLIVDSDVFSCSCCSINLWKAELRKQHFKSIARAVFPHFQIHEEARGRSP